MRWCVGIQADGDEVMSVERIVQLADSVAKHDGVASGVGQSNYGAKIIVDAFTRAEAEEIAKDQFLEAARIARMPDWPISRIESINEEEEDQQDL